MGLKDRLRSIFLSKESVKPAVRKAAAKIPEKFKRVEDKNLEKIYLIDGLAASAIKRIMEQFLASDFRIETQNKELIEKIITDSEFEFLLLQIVKDLLIFGNSYVEAIQNKTGTKIVDLERIDAKTMDFIRDNKNNIIYEDGKVKGYTQELPYDFNISEIPENRLTRVKGKNAIKFDRKDIIHLKLYSVGDSPRGLGMLEPLYNEFKIKLNIQEGLGEAVFRKGYPKLVVELGDPNHPPSQEDIDHMKNKIRNMQNKDEIIVPYYYTLRYLESKHPEQLHASLKFIVDLLISGLGIPKSLLTGLGGETNRATLDKQLVMFSRKIKMLQKLVVGQIEGKLFKRIAREYKIPTPRIVFEEISTDDLNSQAERLEKYAKHGLIDVNEKLKEKLLKKEGLK